MTEKEPANKAEFLPDLAQAWAELQETLAGFSEEQMTQPTDQVGWTVKDHLGHLVSWEEGIIALLKKEPRWEAMGVDVEIAKSRLVGETEDELNQIMRDQLRALSLAEVLERLRRSNDDLTALVESMPAEDLLKGYSHYQPDEPGKDSGAPILRRVVGNSSEHYREHLPWMRDIAAPTAL